jgi:excisionase family DNA binding protein
MVAGVTREREALISVEEAAALLNVSKYTLYDMARGGLLPEGVVVRIGRRVRVNPTALDAFIRAGGCTWPRGWRK